MKVVLEKQDAKYAYMAVVLAVFFAVVFFQYRAKARLEDSIREKTEANARSKESIKVLEASLVVISKKVTGLVTKADSLQESEKKYKNSYYATDKNLKIILGIYAGSTDDDKWDAFSKSLRE